MTGSFAGVGDQTIVLKPSMEASYSLPNKPRLFRAPNFMGLAPRQRGAGLDEREALSRPLGVEKIKRSYLRSRASFSFPRAVEQRFARQAHYSPGSLPEGRRFDSCRRNFLLS